MKIELEWSELENLKDKRLKEFISWVFLLTAITLYIVSL